MTESGSHQEPAGDRVPEQPVPSQPAAVEPGGVEQRGVEQGGGSVPAKDPLRGSRASGLWSAVVALVVLLILLSVFILQNTRSVEIAYFGWEGETPLAAALLIAVAAGLLIAVIAGSLRILQLRRRVRREQKR